jgi:predicted nucleic acid-binding Zn ribbon protein
MPMAATFRTSPLGHAGTGEPGAGITRMPGSEGGRRKSTAHRDGNSPAAYPTRGGADGKGPANHGGYLAGRLLHSLRPRCSPGTLACQRHRHQVVCSQRLAHDDSTAAPECRSVVQSALGAHRERIMSTPRVHRSSTLGPRMGPDQSAQCCSGPHGRDPKPGGGARSACAGSGGASVAADRHASHRRIGLRGRASRTLAWDSRTAKVTAKGLTGGGSMR